jgi:type IV secretion system protein VirB10
MSKSIMPSKQKLLGQVAKVKTVNKLGYYIALGTFLAVGSAFVFAEMGNNVASQDENSILSTAKKKTLNTVIDTEEIKPKDISLNIKQDNQPNQQIASHANNNNDYMNKVLAEEAKEREAIYNNNSNYQSANKKGNIDIPLSSKNNIDSHNTANMPNIPVMPNIPNLQNIDAQMPSMADFAGLGGGSDPNMQAKKEKFTSKSGNFDYLDSQLQQPRSEKEIKAGTVIPAILANSINSDLPNMINAIVSEDVYDSITHTHIIIPKGTKLNGIYDSNLSFGQNGLAVVLNRLVFNNGSTFDLGSMSGADQSGNSGFRDKVNNHYGRTFGSAILVALIGSGMQLSQPKNRTSTSNDAQETITANMAQQTGNTAQGILNKMINVQPTITIKAGYRFNVMVNKDFIIE